MMIAQIVQRLFGPVFQGVGPNAQPQQGGDAAGAFAGLLAEAGDSPAMVEEGSEEAQAGTDAAPEEGILPNPIPAQFSMPLPLIPSQGGAAAQTPMSSAMDGAQTPAAPQDLADLSHGGELAQAFAGAGDAGQGEDVSVFGGAPQKAAVQALKVDMAQAAHGAQGAQGAIVLDAALLTPLAAPDAALSLNTAEMGAPTAMPIAAPATSPAQGKAASNTQGVELAQSLSQPAADASAQAAQGLSQAKKAQPRGAADGQNPAQTVTIVSSPTPAQEAALRTASAAQSVAGEGAGDVAGELAGEAAALQVQSLSQPVSGRPKLPVAGTAVAALQAFAQATLRQSEGAADGESTPLNPFAQPSQAARAMAALYAPSAQTGVQTAVAAPAAFSSQWQELTTGAGGLPLGDGAFAPLLLGDSRSALSTLSSPAGLAGGAFAGQMPSAAQISAQILPVAASVQSGAQSGPVELVLSPAELGSLRFEFQQRGEQVQIVLSAERPETLDLLRRNSEQLLNDFRSAGFAGASLSFGGWGAGQNQGADQQDLANPSQSGGESGLSSATPNPAQMAGFAPPSPYLDPSRSLNLRL